jgi:uncharacterized damage-inducible protein DinB
MSIAQMLMSEFEEQAPVTRRFLERLPEDKLTWKPHAKSMTAGQLALHLAIVPSGVLQAVQRLSAPVPDFKFPEPASLEEVLKAHDAGIEKIRELLPTFDDAAMETKWALTAGEQVVFSAPRGKFLRDVMLNHWYQHRGQFGVYLRLLNIAVPSSWGPSADEMPAGMRQLQPA